MFESWSACYMYVNTEFEKHKLIFAQFRIKGSDTCAFNFKQINQHFHTYMQSIQKNCQKYNLKCQKLIN